MFMWFFNATKRSSGFFSNSAAMVFERPSRICVNLSLFSFMTVSSACKRRTGRPVRNGHRPCAAGKRTHFVASRKT